MMRMLDPSQLDRQSGRWFQLAERELDHYRDTIYAANFPTVLGAMLLV